MKKFLLFLGVALCATFCVNEASAQIKAGEGQVSIALESNNSYYMEDQTLEKIGLVKPDERTRGNFGSNDYIKVDYSKGRFSAGVQVDAYLPGLYGYDMYTYQQRDTKLTGFLTKYIQWEDQNWGVRVGDIFDQFGNGLIFRSYEDRALGFNNSLAGARAHYNFNNMVSVKVVAGMPRLYDVRSNNLVYGADLALSISDMVGWENGIIGIEGSYVGRRDSDISAFNVEDWETGEITNILAGKEMLNMVSGRLNFEFAGVTLRGEYAAKLNEDLFNPTLPTAKGNVIYLDLGYNYKRFSASATFRRMENMTTAIDNRPVGIGGGNVMNYVPLLTRQHTYSLANLNPYRGSSVHTGGEIGGQLDLYYSLRNPKARGKYWNFHLNFSMFNTVDHFNQIYQQDMEGRNVWLDLNFDVERQWNKQVKTTFLYSFQRWDEEINHYDSPMAHYCRSHIFVGDVTYKFNKKHSMRFEAQYLASNDYEGDWVAATIEYNLAPKFSFYVSDMWNCEKMQDGAYGNYYMDLDTYEGDNYLLHYYQVGASFTHNSFRAQLSYGRNRAGFVCSGGVCRFQPAYTGFNLAMTLSF
ncbi:MAG: hypothetical protein J6Q62_00755 [Alistipes sp.]|nr:hypothetical protein [Alistipes sp.]